MPRTPFVAARLQFALALVCALTASHRARAQSTEPPLVWAVPVRDGQARVVLPPAGAGQLDTLVISSLGPADQSHPVRLVIRTAAGTPAIQPNWAPTPPRRLTLKPHPLPITPAGIAWRPPTEQTFHVLAHDGDPASPSNYRAIPATLRALGERVQVYVAHPDLNHVTDDTLQDVVRTFDKHIYPTLATLAGPAADVDNDGRLCILFTSETGRIAASADRVDGFTRGADFDTTLPPPLSNHRDLICLNARLQAGPHLRTVLAHEYAHTIIFSRKVIDARASEEEAWLDEALAHLAEDALAFSRSNIDHRVLAFLNEPERYALLIDDYFTRSLFRSHGHRGCGYSFLRWCADQYGPALMPALITSPARGTSNLEQATGRPFRELYRDWTIALASRGSHAADVRIRAPSAIAAAPNAAPITWLVSGSTTRFVHMSADQPAPVAIEIDSTPAAQLQFTCVRRSRVPSG